MTASCLLAHAQLYEYVLKSFLHSLSAFLLLCLWLPRPVCVFLLSFSVSVGLGLGILIDVSRLLHNKHRDRV